MHLKIYFFFLLLLTISACQRKKEQHNTWAIYRGGNESNCYSSLDQIKQDNVQQLQVAWTYHTGDVGPGIQCNPIVIGEVMYVTSPLLKVIALQAATGEKIWEFNPFTKEKPKGVNRGVVYWANGNDKRILFTAGHNLYALDASTGSILTSFGDNGMVDLRQNLNRDPTKIELQVTSPGIIYNNLLILGSMVSEGEGAAPGHVRAYDIHTGKIAWTFHTIPQPGEFGYDSWEKDAWKEIGGANAWSGFSLDEKRGYVFFATGSCSPDFYGGDRKGQNLFANSVVALNARTGGRIWHYQIVHHDLWDYDLPTPPNLVTVNHNGKEIDAVAQLTKTGNVFVLDRDSGKPLFPVEERKVPQSDIEGEQSWPTQPFPTKPQAFVRQQYTAEDSPAISPQARTYAQERLKTARNEGIFTPPSLQGSVVFPGMRGGAEWNGGSFDPETGLLYVNANEIPNIMQLKRVETEETVLASGKSIYQLNCATCHGIDRKGQPPFPSLLNVHTKLAKAEVKDRIMHGKGQMPAFPNLSAEKVDAIITYLFNEAKEAQMKSVANPSTEALQSPKIKYAHSGYGQFLDAAGYPAVKPPWGTLNAINLNTGELAWKVPLGEYPELTKKGIPVTGTQNFGGTIVTAGGLIFVGATKDEKFRAINKATGKILWETTLPAGGYATPSTYEVNGKQYVVIAAGGAGKNATKPGDMFIAFALPD